MREEEFIQKHDEILNYLLEYKNHNNNFVFSPRQNHNDLENNHLKCRLCNGSWFQGAKNYIFVALYKRGCKDNKTKTIGFVFTEDNQYIEIVFKRVDAITDDEVSLYNELISYLKNSKKIIKIEKRHEQKYFFILDSKDLQENLNYFITDVKNKADELIRKHHLESKYFISEEEFQTRINEIVRIKNTIKSVYNKDLNTMNINGTKKFSKIKNIILYGAPGVGKTHNYKKIVALIEGGDFLENKIFDFIINNKDDEIEEGSIDRLFKQVKDEKRVEFITFHQSYSYEDFIEGFRPSVNGNIELKDGIFKKLCSDAEKSDKNFYIVIDEINRGNISKIFGELITLIEEDKRDIYEVTLPYSKEKFKVPSNLYIIATMNSTDKSIATIDIALRRRFTFLKMKPNETLITFPHAKELFNKLNKFIENNLNEDYKLGHSYFMKITSDEELEFVKEYKIKPLLEEYFYIDTNKLNEALKIFDDGRVIRTDAWIED